MSVFHRIDDARNTMPAPLYFARAELLPAYRGVMRARAQMLEQESGGTSIAPGRVQVSDTTMLAQLEAEGWLEHRTEG